MFLFLYNIQGVLDSVRVQEKAAAPSSGRPGQISHMGRPERQQAPRPTPPVGKCALPRVGLGEGGLLGRSHLTPPFLLSLLSLAPVRWGQRKGEGEGVSDPFFFPFPLS